MKLLVLSLFGLLFTLQTQAQYKISGTVRRLQNSGEKRGRIL